MIALYIFIGGGLGSLARYGLTIALPSDKFPYGTLLCNLLGCLLIGIMMGLIAKPSALQVGIITGCLGGFTTFSAFSYATIKLFENGNIASASMHIGISVIGGVLLTFIGYQFGSSISN